MKEMLKSASTWLLIIFILGVSYIGVLDHKKIATDNQPQYTLQNGLLKINLFNCITKFNKNQIGGQK